MDIRTITATLAILGTGLTLSACAKKGTDATEVPAAQPTAADASCGIDKGHGHASCSADKTEAGEKSCSGAKAAAGEKSCGAKGDGSCGAKGDGSCGAEKPPASAAAEPVSTSPTVAADASTPAATASTKTKTKAKPKTKKANGEAACGEGTCA